MDNKRILSYLLIATCILLMGCQPNPSEEIVKQKNDSSLLEAINDNTEMQATDDTNTNLSNYIYPNTWNEVICCNSSDLEVSIDAVVDVPKVNGFSVATVEPFFIPIEMAEKITEIATQGNPLYSRLNLYTRTKDIIESEILEIQAFLADPSSSDLYNNRAENPDKWEEYLELLEEEIRLLKIEYNNSPVYNELMLEKMEYHCQYIETDIELPNGYTEETWNKLDLYKQQEILYNEAPEVFSSIKCIEGYYYYQNKKGTLKIFNHEGQYMDNCARFSREQILTPNELIFGDQIITNNLESLRDIDLSIIDARNIAKEAIEKIGIENVDIIYQIGTVKEQSQLEPTDSPQCYFFVFGKSINGVTSNYDFRQIGYNKEIYDKAWPYENIIVAIDDSGIINFQWYGPCKINEILTDDVEIMEFTEIQDIFKKYISIENIWIEDENINRYKICINNIKLGMMRIKSNESPTGYFILPVWDFYGYSAYELNDSESMQQVLNENNELILKKYGYSFLTINAIDGSIIDRTMGY